MSDHADEQTTDTGFVTIPEPENLPDVGQRPDYYEPINNMAKDEALAKRFRAWASKRIQHFDTQTARVTFTETKGTMDTADRMERVSLKRDTSSAQHQNTGSNVSSTAYSNAVRAVTAGEGLVFFDGTELPAEFVPEVNTTEYTVDQGKDIAEQQNILEQYTFDEDKRRDKIKEVLWSNNKYANAMVWMEWDRRVEMVVERTPTQFDENGTPIAFDFQEVERVVKDCPTFQAGDMKDFWFDAQIDDMSKQFCIGHRGQVPYDTLLKQQAAGEIANLDKVKLSALYIGDDDEVMADRSANAGEDAVTEENGMLIQWHIEGMVPITENAGKNGKTGKGKWDAKKPAARYWATFIGDIHQGNAVCVRLQKQPYSHGKSRYKLIHSHRDDKGAYHDGFPTRLESLYYQDCTTQDQSFDNRTLICRSPWIIDGQLQTKMKAWRANQLIKVSRGTTFKQADVRDISSGNQFQSDRIQADIQRTTGADKPIVGEALGSRASATEAKQTLDQALVPLDDKAAYLADQLFPWMLEMDASLWRQYGDPAIIIRVTQNNLIREVNPTKLWGPVRTKVTAVSRFRNNVIRRQEINSFIQNAYGFAEKQMDETGRTQFWRDTFREFGFENANEYFPVGTGYDAKSRAREAIGRIVNMGEDIVPTGEENHRAWLAELEPFVRQYELTEGADQSVLQKLRVLVEAHRQMDAQDGQAAAAQMQQGQQQGQAAPVPELPGQVIGDQIEAQEGALPQ